MVISTNAYTLNFTSQNLRDPNTYFKTKSRKALLQLKTKILNQRKHKRNSYILKLCQQNLFLVSALFIPGPLMSSPTSSKTNKT